MENKSYLVYTCSVKPLKLLQRCKCTAVTVYSKEQRYCTLLSHNTQTFRMRMMNYRKISNKIQCTLLLLKGGGVTTYTYKAISINIT